MMRAALFLACSAVIVWAAWGILKATRDLRG